jgi:hypothetical protein
MHLQNPIRHRQANTTALGFRGEVQFENTRQDLWRDSLSPVFDFDDGELVISAQPDVHDSASGHGLHSIEDQV